MANLPPSCILLWVSRLGSCKVLASSCFFVHQKKQWLFTINQVQNVFEIGTINHKWHNFTSSAFWLDPFMTTMNTLKMTAGNVFNLHYFEKNKIKLKQRSFEDFIGTSFVLTDADLLLIWMNNFQLCFRLHLASCPVFPAVLINSWRECGMFQCSSVNVCISTSVSWYFNKIDQIAFPELEKSFCNDFAPFLYQNDWQGYQEINVRTASGLKTPLIYFRHLKVQVKVSWVKACQISCLFIFISMYPRPE